MQPIIFTFSCHGGHDLYVLCELLQGNYQHHIVHLHDLKLWLVPSKMVSMPLSTISAALICNGNANLQAKKQWRKSWQAFACVVNLDVSTSIMPS